MFEIIAITFLSWSVVGVAGFLLGYWHGRSEVFVETRREVADARHRLFTGRALS